MTTHTLDDLAAVSIDSWVEAMAALDDGDLGELLRAEATDGELAGYRAMDCCPAELEQAARRLCARLALRFSSDGTPVRA